MCIRDSGSTIRIAFSGEPPARAAGARSPVSAKHDARAEAMRGAMGSETKRKRGTRLALRVPPLHVLRPLRVELLELLPEGLFHGLLLALEARARERFALGRVLERLRLADQERPQLRGRLREQPRGPRPRDELPLDLQVLELVPGEHVLPGSRDVVLDETAHARLPFPRVGLARAG